MEMNQADRAQLLSIFPEEAWALLFEQVHDPNDLANICNASLFFRELMREKRVLFLFPKVWDILGMKIELENAGFNMLEVRPNGEDDFREEEEEKGDVNLEDKKEEDLVDESFSDDDDPSNRSSQWTDCSSLSSPEELCVHREDVLNLRLVCRNWSTAVATFYQSLPFYYKLEFDAIPRSLSGDIGPVHLLNFAEQVEWDQFRGWTHVKFSDHKPEDLQKFMRDFETSSNDDDRSLQNPFMSRGVSISYCGQSADEFFNYLFQLFAKYGHHVWHCFLETSNYFPTVVDYYSKLKQVLEHLPNLKVLKFDIFLEKGPSGIKWAFCDDEYDEKELQAHIISNPLPRLAKLQFLKTIYLPVPIFNALVGANPHASMLEVIPIDQNQDYDFYAASLPNLSQLSITILSVKDFKRLADSQESGPLAKLYLDYAPPPLPEVPPKRPNTGNWRLDAEMNMCLRDIAEWEPKVLKWSRENLDWSDMFRVIENKWASTLTDVMINLPIFAFKDQELEIMKECPALRLNLPHVKRFKVIMTNVASLDFILPMKDSLELLDITIGFEFKKLRGKKMLNAARDLQRGQVVQFLGYFTETGERKGEYPELKSNIWTIFTKLKGVLVFVTDCMFGNGSVQTSEYRITTREQWLKKMN